MTWVETIDDVSRDAGSHVRKDGERRNKRHLTSPHHLTLSPLPPHTLYSPSCTTAGSLPVTCLAPHLLGKHHCWERNHKASQRATADRQLDSPNSSASPFGPDRRPDALAGVCVKHTTECSHGRQGRTDQCSRLMTSYPSGREAQRASPRRPPHRRPIAATGSL